MSSQHKKHKYVRGRKKTLWSMLFGTQKHGVCYYCKKQLLFGEATIEHIIPLSENGSDKISSGNLNFSCLECNNGRARDAQVWGWADDIAKKLFDMCKGKREITYRWKTLVDTLKKEGNVTIEKCRDAYLRKKGVKPDEWREI